jgi:uncharacterized protein (DUF58 family)
MIIGLAYPWLAVRLIRCELIVGQCELIEDDNCPIEVRVHNHCPWPLWGLIIEGMVVGPVDELDASNHPSADIALGVVPWLSAANYRLELRPRLRGRYPRLAPQLTCAFPFGMWTARRSLREVPAIVVRPRQVKISGLVEQTGQASHHLGNGSRSGGHGDFLGLRDYRAGDSIRHIHWAHTAKLDALVVCERGAAEQSPWRIVLNTQTPTTATWASRDNLAWRVRLAASLCTWLNHQSVGFELAIPGEDRWATPATSISLNRLERALDRLTDVPLSGTVTEGSLNHQTSSGQVPTISIEPVHLQSNIDQELSLDHQFIRLKLERLSSSLRRANPASTVTVDLNQPIGPQVSAWLQRMVHDRHAA